MASFLFLNLLFFWYVKSEVELDSLDNVVKLTNENFTAFKSNTSVFMAGFFAPWCGHCKSFAPVYSKIAKRFSDEGSNIKLAKIDGTKEERLASEHSVQGYPTLFFYKNGERFLYEDSREEEALVTHLKKVENGTWSPPPKAVLTLTSENFTSIVSNESFMMVEFYAPWCGHCKQLAPEYEKAAKSLLKKDKPIKLAAIDATAEPELAKQYNVNGYPTILLFRNGRPSPYNGPRDEYGIVDHMVKNQIDAAVFVETLDDVMKARKVEKATILGYFDSANDSASFRTFLDATNALRDDHHVIYTQSKAVMEHFRLHQDTSLLLLHPLRFHTKYESGHVAWKINESTTVDNITNLVETSFPLVGQYNYKTSSRYDKVKRTKCFFFYTVDYSRAHREATELWRNKIAKIADEYTSIVFMIADDSSHEDIFKKFKLDESGEDINVGCYDSNGQRFAMPPMEEWSDEHIESFLNKLLEGSLKPILRSKIIPKTPQYDANVRILVGNEVLDILHNASLTNLVVLLFDSSIDAGVYNNSLSALSELATKFVDHAEISFAKLDLLFNEIPYIEGVGFGSGPLTLFLVKSVGEKDEETAKKQTVVYDGDTSSLKDISNFLTQHDIVLKASKEEL